MRARTWALAVAATIAAIAPQLVMGQEGAEGYLPAGLVDVVQILAPPPKEGEARYEADRAIFKATRRWQGTPRWEMAVRDAASTPAAMAEDFGCALDVALTPENAPLTLALIHKAAIDTDTRTGVAKNVFKRIRPFWIDPGNATCEPTARLRRSFDYPSGHTTRAWTWALLLAELAPERATPILARGRAYGESRVICGVHNFSAIEAGRVSASATLAAVHSQPEFQSDLAKARAELAALLADPARPRPKACAAEAELVALPIL